MRRRNYTDCKTCRGTGSVMTGHAVSAARTRAGLTQKQLGKRFGVTMQYIGLIEQGRRRVSPRLRRWVEAALQPTRARK